MNRKWIIAGLVLGFAATAFGGPEQIVKQRAKELRDQNNVRQGVAPPTQPPPPPAQATAPAPSGPTLSLSLTRLQSELAGIKPESPATPQMKQLMTAQIIAAAQTAGKPATNTVEKLVEDVTAALAERALPDASRSRLVTELDAVLNPGKYPTAQLPAIYSDVQAIFQANGSTRAKAAAISEGVKAVSAEAQKR